MLCGRSSPHTMIARGSTFGGPSLKNPPVHPAVPGCNSNRLLGFFGPSYYLSTQPPTPLWLDSSLTAVCSCPSRASDKTEPQVSGATGRA
jgi:hypothetical protein